MCLFLASQRRKRQRYLVRHPTSFSSLARVANTFMPRAASTLHGYSDIVITPLQRFRRYHFHQYAKFYIRIYNMESLLTRCSTNINLQDLLKAIMVN
jgi:hypothetical protein